jgi:hypothetical protein
VRPSIGQGRRRRGRTTLYRDSGRETVGSSRCDQRLDSRAGWSRERPLCGVVLAPDRLGRVIPPALDGQLLQQVHDRGRDEGLVDRMQGIVIVSPSGQVNLGMARCATRAIVALLDGVIAAGRTRGGTPVRVCLSADGIWRSPLGVSISANSRVSPSGSLRSMQPHSSRW